MTKLRTILLMSITFGLALSFCDSERDHKQLIGAYKASTTKKLLGHGAFGQVYEFTDHNITYAVKEVHITLKNDSYKRFKAKYAGNDQGKIDRIELLIGKVNNLIRPNPEIYKHKETTRINMYKEFHKEALTEFDMKVIADYMAKIVTHITHLEKEVKINKLISNESSLGNKMIDHTFRFCVRKDGLNYILFQDKNAYALSSSRFAARVKRWRIKERLHFFANILKQVQALHDLSVAHCDLKEENIMMKSEFSRESSLIDFGIGETEDVCNGGTTGYMAPELYTNIHSYDQKAMRYKADVFSMALIIANIEVRRIISDSDVARAVKNVVDENEKDYPNRENTVKDLAEVFLEATQSMQPSSMDIGINEETLKIFNKKFVNCITSMVKFDPVQRLSSRVAYVKFWELYQLSRLLETPPKLFEEAATQLELHIKKTITLDKKLPELSLEGFSLETIGVDLTKIQTQPNIQPSKGNQLRI
jgi:serine/threonine protein kinase